MPDRIRIAGDSMEPADKITSLSAKTTRSSFSDRMTTPFTRVSLNKLLETGASVKTLRFFSVFNRIKECRCDRILSSFCSVGLI